MSTAICRSYTKDGFIIAADGREMAEPGLLLLSDERQKIFQAGGAPIVYCAMGMTILGDRRESRLETVLFNFNQHLAQSALAAATQRFDSMEKFAAEVCRSVCERLSVACASGNVDLSFSLGGNGPEQTIVTVFFDGYLSNGTPGSAQVRFAHEAELPHVEVTSQELGVHFYGSQAVENEMKAGSKFDKYTRRELPPRSLQLSDELNRMIRESVNYITACSSPEAKELAPEQCVPIGGRIHVARITPNVGVSWVRGYEPAMFRTGS